MHFYLGVTDNDWFATLRDQQALIVTYNVLEYLRSMCNLLRG